MVISGVDPVVYKEFALQIIFTTLPILVGIMTALVCLKEIRKRRK